MELEDEFAQLQQLSNRYVPDVEVSTLSICLPYLGLTICKGDLVGQLQSTGAITVEYAKADPIYISKTQVGSDNSNIVWTSLIVFPGHPVELLSLSTDLGRWKLWLARYKSYAGDDWSLYKLTRRQQLPLGTLRL